MRDLFLLSQRFLDQTGFAPEIAVVLGSGLGEWAHTLTDAVSYDYAELGLTPSGVIGHGGKLVLGTKYGKRIACLQGRIHYYEGHEPQTCVENVRFVGLLGARSVILTNAAGGIAPTLHVGDIMQITDHICLVPSPLRGPNDDRLGTRFPDMTAVYDAEFIRSMQQYDTSLRQGVYLQVSGPNYETPAEIRAYRSLGADAVGMSTAIEAIAARHMGLRVVGYSTITNAAAGVTGQPLSHDEVTAVADASRSHFTSVLDRTVTLL